LVCKIYILKEELMRQTIVNIKTESIQNKGERVWQV